MGGGHKTFVAHIKFKRVRIELSNGFHIEAHRPDRSLVGSFQLHIKHRGKRIGSAEFALDSENAVRPRTPEEDKRQEELMDLVASLGLSVYLLSDDRRIQVSSPDIMEKYLHETPADQTAPSFEQRARQFLRPKDETDSLRKERELAASSLERASRWIRQQVLGASARGEYDVNLVYSDILNRITSAPSKGKARRPVPREVLAKRIAKLRARTRNFHKIGLTSRFDAAKLLGPLERASGGKLGVVRRILEPYLDSLEARLNALSDIQARVKTLMDTINSFLIDKTVEFHVAKGFNIKSRNQEVITPAMLSSGERHLFVMLCNTVTALGKQSIFIIDEPELSLNVKWQRRLISSLLECAKSSPVQYLFATHSLELLAQHMDKVVKLETRRK